MYQCAGCEALFIHPWLKNDELSLYYPDDYGRYRHSRSLERKGYTGVRRFVLENHYNYPSTSESPSLLRKWAAYLLSFVTAKGAIPYRGDGRFLDVGAGGGTYLYRLRQWGWDVYGVEPSAAGAAQARSLGLNVFQGRIEEAGLPDGFFAVVRLSHVLEHLPDPRGTLREIRRILKPDGLIYITVPNTLSLTFWLFGANWYALEAPRHVISYRPKTLEFLCRATGFKIVRMRFRSGPFNFVRSLKYYLEESGDGWPDWMRRINWSSNKLIRRSLKPLFFLVDIVGLGDVMEVTLAKDSSDPLRANGSVLSP